MRFPLAGHRVPKIVERHRPQAVHLGAKIAVDADGRFVLFGSTLEPFVDALVVAPVVAGVGLNKVRVGGIGVAGGHRADRRRQFNHQLRVMLPDLRATGCLRRNIDLGLKLGGVKVTTGQQRLVINRAVAFAHLFSKRNRLAVAFAPRHMSIDPPVDPADAFVINNLRPGQAARQQTLVVEPSPGGIKVKETG